MKIQKKLFLKISKVVMSLTKIGQTIKHDTIFVIGHLHDFIDFIENLYHKLLAAT
jgi:hypothetical protein